MIIKTLLYNGEVEIIFDSFRHTYTNAATNQEVKSVTQILDVINKPGLIPWAARMAVDSFKENVFPGVAYDEVQLSEIFDKAQNAHYRNKISAGNKGTIVHKWVEKNIKENATALPVNQDLAESAIKWLAWRRKHKVEFLLSEQPVYSRQYGYIGTADFNCRIDGKLFLGDLKTTTAIRVENYFQTAAYRHAREEEFPEEKYAGQMIVRISREGEFEFAIVQDDVWYKRMFLGFLSAQKLSQFQDMTEKFKPTRQI